MTIDEIGRAAGAQLREHTSADVEVRKSLGTNETLLSIDKARRVLGYEPQFSWRDELRR